MAEFASNAKGNLAVTLGSIGAGVSLINSMRDGNFLGGLFGGGNNRCEKTPSETTPAVPAVNRYELALQNRISELEGEVKLRDSYIYTDSRFTSGFEKLTNKYDAEIAELKAQINHQSVINAQITANLSCMQGSINTLMGLTKTVIPIGSVCPTPMPEYNSWTAPTTPTTGA